MAKVLREQPTQRRKQAQIEQVNQAQPEPSADDELIEFSMRRSEWERFQALFQEWGDYFKHLIPGMPQGENRTRSQMLVPEMMNMEQARAYLGNLSRRFIEYEVAAGRLHAKHFGRAVRFEKTELDRYKKAH